MAERVNLVDGGEYDLGVPELQLIDEQFARMHISRLAELANHIPEVDYTEAMMLAVENPDGRQFTDKWQHSFALVENGEVVGMVIGYRRAAEDNGQYPVESLYMSELVVDRNARGKGYARQLIRQFLQKGLDMGVKDFTLQTNAADWNDQVRRLYEDFGYAHHGEKQYNNRTDVIMRASADDIRQNLG